MTWSWRVTLHREELRTSSQYCGSTMPRRKGAFLCYLAGELSHNRLQTRDGAQFTDWFLLQGPQTFSKHTISAEGGHKVWMAWMGDVFPSRPVSREYRYPQTSLGDLNLSYSARRWEQLCHILFALLFCSSLSILLIPFYLTCWTLTWVILNKNHSEK